MHKGTLISEPRFSTPCEMPPFFRREKGKTAFVEENVFLEKAVFPFSRGKHGISQGVENRGSLISVPLALRVLVHSGPPTVLWTLLKNSILGIGPNQARFQAFPCRLIMRAGIFRQIRHFQGYDFACSAMLSPDPFRA